MSYSGDTTPIEPFSVQDILNQVYVNVDDDISSATSDDAEWTARVYLINSAIAAWERQDVYWRELWTQWTGSTVITAGVTTYPISTIAGGNIGNFRQPGSLLYLTNPNGGISFIDIVSPEQAIKYVNQNSDGALGGVQGSAQAAFITGNQATGWTLNLTWTPVAGDNTVGCTPSFYYYKSANRVASPTDVVEMSDPSYCVWYVTAQKQLYYNRTDMASDAQSQATEAMYNMRIKNELMVNYGDNVIEDIDLFRGNDSLGT